MQEKLKPEQLGKEIRGSKENLEWLQRYLEDYIKKAPPGNLKVSRKKHTYQFFYMEKKDDKTGKYIKRAEASFVKKLQQKAYAKKLLVVVKANLQAIGVFEKHYIENAPLVVYHQFSEIRQQYISPFTLADEEYIQRWIKIAYRGNSYKLGRSFNIRLDGRFCTAGAVTGKNGDMKVCAVGDDAAVEVWKEVFLQFRSKSEVIIATILNQYRVPFRYEYPVRVGEGRTVYPDFYCLNVRTREEFVWEHLGLIDNKEYAAVNAQKMSDYMEAGFCPGKNLIMTMETDLCPLQLELVEKIVKEVLV